MKKISFAIVLVFIGYLLQAQDFQKNLKADFAGFIQATSDKDFEEILNYFPKSFFNHVPRETMLEVMEQTLNNPAVSMEYNPAKITEISKKISNEGKSYAKFKYSQTYYMSLAQGENEKSSAFNKRMSKAEPLIRKSLLNGVVEYDKEKRIFVVSETKEVYAISESENTEWKFLTIDPQSLSVINAIIPEEVRTGLE